MCRVGADTIPVPLRRAAVLPAPGSAAALAGKEYRPASAGTARSEERHPPNARTPVSSTQ
jgi:hypothetical protein